MNWGSLIGSSLSPEILDLEVLLFIFLSTGKCFTYHSTWEVFWFLDSTKRPVSEWLRQQAPSIWETFKDLAHGPRGADAKTVCGFGNEQEEGLSAR